ncbi:MAG: hypothetical protein OJF50_000692 [Nitrospira sp.]|nr:hypothetical protein [Nitrospira sp.]
MAYAQGASQFLLRSSLVRVSEEEIMTVKECASAAPAASWWRISMHLWKSHFLK